MLVIELPEEIYCSKTNKKWLFCRIFLCMNLFLNIETATEICSVALCNENEVIDYRENLDGKSHAALLTIFIDDILKKNHTEVKDLSAVAVSMGPGSYTGLRIGVSAAKGLCYGHSLPLIAIPTLQILSNQLIQCSGSLGIAISPDDLLCPMIDARRLEVYTALFDARGKFTTEVSAEIINETSFKKELANHKIYFFGNGAHKCKGILTHPNAWFLDGVFPSAKYMTELAKEAFVAKQFEDVAYFEPFYLKDFVATVAKNKVLGDQIS
jgi:tRNA threonylcarbamoyladenosine biosynthesis protein TsaB